MFWFSLLIFPLSREFRTLLISMVKDHNLEAQGRDEKPSWVWELVCMIPYAWAWYARMRVLIFCGLQGSKIYEDGNSKRKPSSLSYAYAYVFRIPIAVMISVKLSLVEEWWKNWKSVGHRWRVDPFTLCGLDVVIVLYSMLWA